jgi:hypothetical protein
VVRQHRGIFTVQNGHLLLDKVIINTGTDADHAIGFGIQLRLISKVFRELQKREEPMPKIAVMEGVREYGEDYPVELWRNDKTGRLVIRAFNEGNNNFTEVDLWDLIEWVQKNEASLRKYENAR